MTTDHTVSRGASIWMLDLETRTGARVLRAVRRRLGCAPSSRTSGRWSSGSVLPVVGVRPVNVVRDSQARRSALVTVAIEYSAPTGWLATTAMDESAAEVDQGTAYACPMHAHAAAPRQAASNSPQLEPAAHGPLLAAHTLHQPAYATASRPREIHLRNSYLRRRGRHDSAGQGVAHFHKSARNQSN